MSFLFHVHVFSIHFCIKLNRSLFVNLNKLNKENYLNCRNEEEEEEEYHVKNRE
jgi:hypothetical protein